MRWLLLGSLLLVACDSTAAVDAGPPAMDAGPPPPRRDAGPDDPSRFVDPAAFEYDWSCSGEVAPTLAPLDAPPPVEDCSAGVWPDLDPTVVACPTVTDATRTDPVSGMSLPPDDARALPIDIPVTETGSFRNDPAPMTWPRTLRVVVWNTEYTANLDAQLETLTTHPELRDADLYLLSEVDRCSARNGTRRAARMLAERIEGDYAYGIEFVELSIGRTLGGDTGQAIVSRRPLSGAVLTCHSAFFDWFASEGEPRLGSRVVLHADLPVGDTHARVWSLHFESVDALGEYRAVQAKELLDAAQATACDRPQIVAGDFNAWYATAPELEVFRRSGFTEAMETLGDTGSTHASGRRLDYAWTRGWRVIEGGVLRDVETSDHSPLWVELELAD